MAEYLNEERNEANDENFSLFLVFLSILVSPFLALIMLVFINILEKKLYRQLVNFVVFLGGVGVLFYLYRYSGLRWENFSLLLAGQQLANGILSKNLPEPVSLFKIWNKLTLENLGLILFFQGIAGMVRPATQSEQIKEINRVREKQHLDSLPSSKVLDMSSKEHLFCIGTTGSGKTSNIVRYIDKIIRTGGFSVIIDGKGGLGEYDLGTITQKLADKHGRKLYVVNQTEIDETDAYNPFYGLSATQIKDMLVNMSEWESEHYKNQASRYWQVMAQVLEKCDIPRTFQSLITFSTRKKFLSLLDEARKEELIDQETYELAENLANSDCGKQAEISISRSAVVAEGDGRKLFGGSDAFNLRSAYDENAIVLVLLNDFNYGDFARSVGKLVVDDIKALVGELQKKQKKGILPDKDFLLVLEELGVYADTGIEGLLNRSRSVGAKVICSMQTTADIDRIDKGLTRQVLGNCNEFLIMRTIDSESAELIAKTVGTTRKIEKTTRTSEKYATGESSNKVVDGFRISPNDIKNLPKNYGFFYSKNEPNKVKRLKTKFVKV